MEVKRTREILAKLKNGFDKNDNEGYGKFVYILNDTIMSYNGKVAVSTKIEPTNINIALPCVEFDKFINRVKGKEFTIETNKDITLKCGRAKAHFPIDEEAVARIQEIQFDRGTLKDLPKDFIEGLKLTGYSVGSIDSIPYTCFVDVKDNEIFSTNNWTISKYVLNENVDDMTIPKSVLDVLTKNKFEKYEVNGTFARFVTLDDIDFIIRLDNVEMPPSSDFFETEGQVFQFPTDMIDMISTAEIAVDSLSSSEKLINITVTEGILTCSSDSDALKIEVEAEIDSEIEFSIDTSAKFLSDILKLTNEVVIDENRLLFETDNFQHIVALMSDD